MEEILSADQFCEIAATVLGSTPIFSPRMPSGLEANPIYPDPHELFFAPYVAE